MPDPGDDARTDAELLSLAASGSDDAFAVFVARHAHAVHRFASLLLADGQRAEEVLQHTFVQAWRHAASARATNGARPWLLTIARHAAMRAARTAREDTVSLQALGADAGFADPGATPDRFAQSAESQQLLRAALDALPPADREVLVLRELEQLPGEQVAALLGLSLPAMKSRLHRARLRLVAELRRRWPAGGEP